MGVPDRTDLGRVFGVRLRVRRSGGRSSGVRHPFLDFEHGLQSHDVRRVRLDLSDRVQAPVRVDRMAALRILARTLQREKRDGEFLNGLCGSGLIEVLKLNRLRRWKK
jgi:hypothetical protein